MYEGKVVILTEKPMVANTISKPFPHKKINNYTIEILPNQIFPQGAHVIWGVSQIYVPLLTNLKNGPVTEEFSLVKKDVLQVEELEQLHGGMMTGAIREHLAIIKEELNGADLIMDAFDYDEIGDAIFELFYKFSGTKTNQIFKYKCYSYLEEEIILSYERAEKIKDIKETEEYMKNMITFLNISFFRK